jgi:nonsense-mediated mRNA decay protein 3
MFCVVCGKETPMDELRGGVCVSCYLEKNVLASVKDNVDLEVCVHCHARKRGEIWLEGHGSFEPIVEDAVREAVFFPKVVDRPRVSMEVIPEDERNFTVHILASGNAEGVPFETKLKTRSRVKNGTCLRCSRIQGGYYEAIVQIRATKRAIQGEEMRALKAFASRFIERVVADGDRNAFVLRDEEIAGGLDVYMGTTNGGRMLAKQVAQEFGGKVTEHGKTVGQKDGLDIIRLTFALRLPQYKAGDVIVIHEEASQITSVGAKTVQVVDLRTGKAKHVERDLVDKALVLKSEDAQEAILVADLGHELQLLDPVTYATVHVRRPEGFALTGETVKVLRLEGDLLILRPARVLAY